MKITLDQDTLRQAVISHLRDAGVVASVLSVNFRYTRVPYAVFAEVELSDTKPPIPKPIKATAEGVVVEREVVVPIPLVDPDKLEPIEPTDTEESTSVDTSTPNAPLFGD
jgi:hypothetical protein